MEQEKSLPELEAELVNYEGIDKVISSYELDDYYKTNSIIEGKIRTGLFGLDNLIKGFNAGEVITVSGRTGCGKTSLTQTFTHNFAVRQISCLWFTYEMQTRYFLNKFPEGERFPLFYLPRQLTESSLSWIERRIIEAKLKYNTEVIFIDHLHYLMPMTFQGNVSLMIGSIMRELKKLAIKHNVVIFIIAHTEKIRVENIKPSLSWIRDSSFVAQESDDILIINRIDYDEDEAICNTNNESSLWLLKNRREGLRGKIQLKYIDRLFQEVMLV